MLTADFPPKEYHSEASASSSSQCLGKHSLAFDINLLPFSDGEGDGELVDGHTPCVAKRRCRREEDQKSRNVGVSEFSCEDEDGASVNRKKLRLSKQQTSFLEDSFRHHITLHPDSSCEEEDGASMNQKKLRLSKQQTSFHKDKFHHHITLHLKQKDSLATQLNLKPRQVEVWFQNRRARMKLKQTEVESEALKQRYQSLQSENRRLEKEVQHLRAAFKVAVCPPYYMPLPAAATLTMCPSCQQVTPSSLHTHNPQEQRKSYT